MKKGSYLLISPCRDEAEYMEATLDSVVAQSEQPALWVIVDDGSTDGSSQILARYAEQYSFIRIVTREDRGYRAVGPGVVDAFYAGYSTVNASLYEFVCKLDLDLDLPPDYFKTLIREMDANPRLGSCSGKPYNLRDGVLFDERRGDELSVGMTKFYRRLCFEQIGGFVREVMWDAIDCHKSRQLGWQVASWDRPELRFIHLRVMGSSQQGVITGRMRHGYGQYFMGTSLAYLVATAIFRMREYPVILGGLATIWGYLRCYWNPVRKLADEPLREFISSYQWRCLVIGKDAATWELESTREQHWTELRPAHAMPLSSEVTTNVQ